MFRAAVIGCGPRGCEHAHALTQLAGVTLAGICDREPAVLAPAIRALAAPVMPRRESFWIVAIRKS